MNYKKVSININIKFLKLLIVSYLKCTNKNIFITFNSINIISKLQRNYNQMWCFVIVIDKIVKLFIIII